MTPIEEKKRLDDVLFWEANPVYCRSQARFENDTGATAAFKKGTVLEFDTNHYQPADGTSGDAILLEDVASLADGSGVDNVAMLVRGPAIVNQDELEWDSGATQATVITDLASIGIQVIRQPSNVSVG